MKKYLIYSIIFIILVVLIKYRFSNYELSYKVDNYDIK